MALRYACSATSTPIGRDESRLGRDRRVPTTFHGRRFGGHPGRTALATLHRMDRDILVERFADLVVRAGANIQPGQHVFVTADIAHAAIARAVVEHAYQAGAGFVEVSWSDTRVRRSAVQHASVESLRANRSWVIDRHESLDRECAALIALTGDPDPALMNGLDPRKVAAAPAEEDSTRRRVLLGGRVTWTIVAAPNAGWARQIFGEPDLDRLWAAVAVAMRLDEPDPVAAWRERTETLAARARALDALRLTSVRYQAGGTDLVAGLLPGTRWTGGGIANESGVAYMPNIPTEEVFTSPDRRLADGTIQLTKPLVLPGGGIVEGLRATFARGRIVDVSATAGADLVRTELDADEGARSLGEVSLVDRDSRIAKARIVFHNTLFDENAACHVAWGQSFPFAVEGGPAMSPEQRFALGLNTSAVHTDVVIGGTGMTVTGTGPNGTIDIIKNDEWVLGAA
jgi:aminopeptidase